VQAKPKTVFWAADEAGLYLQATTSFAWSVVGETPIVRADAGRKQTHFYGAVNLMSGKEIVLRSDVMCGEISAQFLMAILEATPQAPVVIFWDRAPWHRGEEVAKIVKDNPRLEIIFFPPASPDLNPQEHVWKAARRAVSHNHSIASLPALADKFVEFLSKTSFPSSFLDRYGYNAVRPLFI
jgi:transposase